MPVAFCPKAAVPQSTQTMASPALFMNVRFRVFAKICRTAGMGAQSRRRCKRRRGASMGQQRYFPDHGDVRAIGPFACLFTPHCDGSFLLLNLPQFPLL